jgi:hypothetical protein
MKRLRRITLAVVLLSISVSLIACSAQGTSGPTAGNVTSPLVPTTLPPTGSSAAPTSTPVNTEFARMLGYIPYSFLEEHDIWFSNPVESRKIYGITNADSYESVMKLTQDERKQLATALNGIAPPPNGRNMQYDLAKNVGFDDWMADRSVFPSVLPPWTFNYYEGNFDDALIENKLTEQGYEKLSYGPYTYYSIRGDFEIDANNEMVMQGVLASLNRIAVLENGIITAPATGILTGILDAIAGNAESLMDKASCHALFASLGDVLSGVIISPARVIDPAPGHSGGLPLFDFTVPADWGTLHQYDLIGLGYKDDGQHRSWLISLYYTDPQGASGDASLLSIRMNSYLFNTQYKDRQSMSTMMVKPLTDRFEVGKPVVQTYPGGATLTIECKFRPETSTGAWLSPTYMVRDLLFLAPDPSPYVKK